MAINEFINYFENDESFDEKRIYLPKDSVSYVADTHEVSYKITEAFNYRFVEYIQNTSNAYINTGINPTNKIRIETVLKCNSRKAQMQLFGCYGSKISIEVYTNGQQNASTLFAFSMQDISDGGDWVSTGVYSSDKLKFIWDGTQSKGTGENKNGLTIYNMDGTLLKYTAPRFAINANTLDTSTTIFICTCNPTGAGSGGVGVGRFTQMNIYSFKIINTNDNTVLRDFVPARRISDGVYGLYDNIDNQFYTSPNGTLFNGA